MFDIKYVRPDSLNGALDFLDEYGVETEILAGGTDVVVDLKAGELRKKKYLLDIGRLEALRAIDFGPLDSVMLERMQKIGAHIHGKGKLT